MRKQLSFFCFFAIIAFLNPYLSKAQNTNHAPNKPTGIWVFDDNGNMVMTKLPIIQFTPSRSHDFGTVVQSSFVSYDFLFSNTGLSPLQISRVNGSCHCTKAEWSPQVIAPGEQGYIRVFYDTRSKLGKFRAAVTVSSNAYGSTTEHLFVEGEIVPDTK